MHRKHCHKALLAGILALLILAAPVFSLAQPALAESASERSYTNPQGWARNEEGQWVFFHGDGTLYTNEWMFESGKWFYFNQLGIMVTGVVKIHGAYERFNENGIYQGKVTGWCNDLIPNQTVYMDSRGHMVTGLQTIDGNQYYFDPVSGALYRNGWWSIPGKTDAESTFLYIAGDGTVYPDIKPNQWIRVSSMNHSTWQIDKNWAYFENGEAYRSKWAKMANSWYYFDARGLALADGSFTIGGKQYSFDSAGIWIESRNSWSTFTDQYGQIQWIYTLGNGYAATGWQYIGGYWYYFDENGTMVYGAHKIDGKHYYFRDNGAMYTSSQLRGWVSICENFMIKYSHWYYFDSTGNPLIGWHRLGGYWYYFDSTGRAVTGQRTIDGKQYYFLPDTIAGRPACSMGTGWILDTFGNYLYALSDGSLVTGSWLSLGGKWYHMDAYGVMDTQWEKIDGNWYYFGSDGAMRANTTVDGKYYVDASGRWIP